MGEPVAIIEVQVMVMLKNISVVLYVMLLIGVVVSVDIVFFRHYFWERLTANIGLVMVFASFYLRFFKKP